jgi:HD superfamily phosphohydrolase
MDYLARDAHHVGMTHCVSIEARFLQTHSTVHDGEIVYERSDGVYSRVNSVFTSRAQMHAKVYQSAYAPARTAWTKTVLALSA